MRPAKVTKHYKEESFIRPPAGYSGEQCADQRDGGRIWGARRRDRSQALAARARNSAARFRSGPPPAGRVEARFRIRGEARAQCAWTGHLATAAASATGLRLPESSPAATGASERGREPERPP